MEKSRELDLWRLSFILLPTKKTYKSSAFYQRMIRITKILNSPTFPKRYQITKARPKLLFLSWIFQYRCDVFFNLFPIQRILNKETVNSEFGSHPPVCRQIMIRQHRNPDIWKIPFNFLSQLKAILSGQKNVQKNEIRRPPTDYLQCLFAVSCLLNDRRGKFITKNHFKYFPKVRIILNNQRSQHISSPPKSTPVPAT